MTKKSGTELLKKLLEVGGTKPTKGYYIKRFDIEFELQAIDSPTLKKIRSQATYPTKNGEEINEDELTLLVIVEGMVEPNLKSADIMEKFGTPVDAANTLFLPGEKSKLSDAIMGLSGYGEDESVESIKN